MPAPSVSSSGAYVTAQNDLAINTGVTLAGTGNLLLIVEQSAKALVAGMIAPKLDGVDMTQIGTTNGPLTRYMAVTTAGARTLTTRTAASAYEAHMISWRTWQDTATSGARYQNPQNFSGSSTAPSSSSLTCPSGGALDAGYVKLYSGSAPTISAGTQLGALFDGGTGNSMAGGSRSTTGAIAWASGDSNAWYLSALEILGDALAGFTGGATLGAVVASGSLQSVMSGFSAGAALGAVIAGGSLGATPGTFVLGPIKVNGVAAAGAAIDYVRIYSDAGVLLYERTGGSLDGTGSTTLSTSSAPPGTAVRIDWQLSSGRRRMPRVNMG